MAYGSSIPGSMRFAAASTLTSVSWTRSSAAASFPTREKTIRRSIGNSDATSGAASESGRAPSSSAPSMPGTLRPITRAVFAVNIGTGLQHAIHIPRRVGHSGRTCEWCSIGTSVGRAVDHLCSQPRNHPGSPGTRSSPHSSNLGLPVVGTRSRHERVAHASSVRRHVHIE